MALTRDERAWVSRILVFMLIGFLLLPAHAPLAKAWWSDPARNTPVCTASGDQTRPSIVSDGSGGAIITWHDGRGADVGIYAQKLNSWGAPGWAANGVAMCTASGSEPLYPFGPLPAAADGLGGAIVAWDDARTNPAQPDIYAQRVDCSGRPVWTANGTAICTALGNQSYPAIVSDGSGGAIIAWTDNRSGNYDIYAERVDSSGTPAPGWPGNGTAICTASGNQSYPAIVSDGSGGAIIAWMDDRSGNYDIYAQRVGSSGTPAPGWPVNGNGTPICTEPSAQGGPQIVSNGSGGAVITWEDGRDTVNQVDLHIYAQGVDSSGVCQWTPNGVDACPDSSAQQNCQAISDGSGGIIVVWYESRAGALPDIYAQRVDSSGALRWTSGGTAVCNDPGVQYFPAVASDGSGGAIVAWDDWRGGWGGDADIYAQKVNALGEPLWTPNGVAISTPPGPRGDKQLVGDGAGGAIIAWEDGRGGSDIYAQRVKADGSLPDDYVLINEMMFDPEGANDAGNEWVELYNRGPGPTNLSGWTISNSSANPAATLPNWELPGGAYLVVYFGTGVNDSDFSDGSGSFYTQSPAEVFANSCDEVALYDGAPGTSTIVDYMAWRLQEADCAFGSAHGHAVAAGIWDAEEFWSDLPPYDFAEHTAMLPGDTLGRDKDSTDTNQPGDWGVLGGRHAIGPTPGRINWHRIGLWFQPPLPARPPPKDWTFMAYINGDDTDPDLDKYFFRDLNEMEKVGSSANVNIVFQFDGARNVGELVGHSGNLTLRDGSGGRTFRGYLEPETDGNATRVKVRPAPDGVYDFGERNMANAGNLTEFITWAMNDFQAHKYALVIFSHGDGWKGVSIDSANGTSMVDWLYMDELDQALDDAPLSPRLDLLAFNACLMGTIEVADQVRDYAGVLVASEENMPGYGLPYDAILGNLTSNPGWGGAELGRKMVQCYAKYYRDDHPDHHNGNWTLSAINLQAANFTALVSHVDQFASDMVGPIACIDLGGLEDYGDGFSVRGDPSDNVQMAVKAALDRTKYYRGDRNFVDLCHLMENVNTQAHIPADCKQEATAIVNAIQPAGQGRLVLAEEHVAGGGDNSHGLSIYFPRRETRRGNWTEPGHGLQIESPFDNPWPSCMPDQPGLNPPLATYAEDTSTEWGMVPYPPASPPHPLPETPDLWFRDDTWWDEFLHRYYKPVADAGEDRAILTNMPFEMVRLDGSGSSDSDGSVIQYVWDLYSDEWDNTGDWDRDDPTLYEPNHDNNLPPGSDLTSPTQSVALGRSLQTRHITLTVWDDHRSEPNTPVDYLESANTTHLNHWQTDQDEVYVKVGPLITQPDQGPSPQSRHSTDPVCFLIMGVLGSGNTTIEMLPGNPAGPLPPGYTVACPFVDITTTAPYEGPITIDYAYDRFSVGNETNLRLFHWNGTEWENVTTYVDTGNKTVHGELMTLSPFFVGEKAVDVPLKAGWNMVSVPVTPIDSSPGAVFPGVAAVYTWDPGNRTYIVPTTIESDTAYWVAATGDGNVTVLGTHVGMWTRSLEAGWNMIGSVMGNATIADPDDNPDGSVLTVAYRWDPLAKTYVLTTDIEPAKGYWAAATQDCTLSLIGS